MNAISFLGKEERQKSRQYELDLLKALALVTMTICHAIIALGKHQGGYNADFPYWLGRVVIGDYFAVAHAFMFAMGVGITYSRKSTPSDLMRRGLRIYILGYILNFFRYGIYNLALMLFDSSAKLSKVIVTTLTPDILQFAGLALIFTGLLKQFKLNELHIFIVGSALSALGTIIPFIDTGNFALNYIIGHFINTTTDTSYFSLFHWYFFVSCGLLFGAVIRRVEDLERFYRRTMIIFGSIAAVYLAASFVFGEFFLSRWRTYEAASLPEAVGLLSIDLFLLTVFHYILKKVDISKLSFCVEMSKNVNEYYMLHWIILGFIDAIFCYLLGIKFSYTICYIAGILLVAVSFGLIRLHKKMHSKTVDIAEKKAA